MNAPKDKKAVDKKCILFVSHICRPVKESKVYNITKSI